MDDLKITVSATVNARGTVNKDLGTVEDKEVCEQSESITYGTGANQANEVWGDKRTLAATSETLDLSGVLVNGFGSTVTLSKVKGIEIRNLSTTSGEVLTVGGAASNQFLACFGSGTDKIKIGAGGVLLLTAPVDGFTVTGGTADQLKIDSGAATLDYQILIWGN